MHHKENPYSISQAFLRFRKLSEEAGLVNASLKTIKFGFGLVHSKIRYFLPSVQVKTVGQRHLSKLGDSWNVRVPYGKEIYEEGIVKALNSELRETDRVIVIGGGYGITSLLAANKAKEVRVYEPSEVMLKEISRVLSHKKNVDIVQGFFYDDENVYTHHSAKNFFSGDLMSCDVLELDCEGAEKQILANLEIQPRAIVVETHGIFGSPTSEIQSILNTKGYDVISTFIEHEKEDIKILHAVRR